MNIGKLRHRVELKSATTEQDGYGESVETWSGDAYTTVWASIEPLSGRELEHAQQITAETNHRIRIRYNSSVAAEHRAYWGSRIFEITAIINPEERNIYQDLYCKEIG